MRKVQERAVFRFFPKNNISIQYCMGWKGKHNMYIYCRETKSIDVANNATQTFCNKKHYTHIGKCGGKREYFVTRLLKSSSVTFKLKSLSKCFILRI